MLAPSRVKYRKLQKGRLDGIAYRGSTIAFGEFGLQALEPGWVTERQIEAGRIAINRHLKRNGKLWIRVFPQKPVGKKPAEVRMGKGKGTPDSWVVPMHTGVIMYEILGVDEVDAKEALRLASHKLPIRTKIVKRSDLL